MKVWNNISEEDLPSVAEELKSLVQEQAVILLSGDVGAGKTTFVRQFIGDQMTTSPTYSLINDCDNYIHADFYRVSSASEILYLELPLYLETADYFLVEWGMPYLKELERLVPEKFLFYEFQISTVDSFRRQFSLIKL